MKIESREFRFLSPTFAFVSVGIASLVHILVGLGWRQAIFTTMHLTIDLLSLGRCLLSSSFDSTQPFYSDIFETILFGTFFFETTLAFSS